MTARAGWILVALLCALTALPAGAAHASATQESLFMDDNRLLYRGNEISDETLEELAGLGVDRVRVTVLWRNFVPGPRPADPTDPAQYAKERWDEHDHLVRKARQFGIDVLFNVTGGGPDWALGKPIKNDRASKKDGDVRPSAKEFGLFVRAVGRRYDGTYKDENQGGGTLPRVDHWSIWNEPNRGTLLAPSWVKVGRRWKMASPRLYRGIVRRTMDALAATGHGADTILLGETSPTGNPGPGDRSHIKPLAFLRELFCLGKKLKPYSKATARRHGCDWHRRGMMRVSGYAHHPYSVTDAPGRESTDPDELRLADVARLVRLLDAAAVHGRIPADLPIWYTEYGYESEPDPRRGLPLDRQAAWNAQAEYFTRALPRIAAHAQFLLHDGEPQYEYKPTDSRYWGTYQSGLRTAGGEPKPALNAYRLPLTAPPGAPMVLWGLVRPLRPDSKQPAEVVLQYRATPDARWTNLRTVPVDRPTRGFVADVAGAQPGEFRVLWPPPQQPRPRGPLDPPRAAPAEPFASEPVRLPVE